MEVLITGASSYVGAKIYSNLSDRFETMGTYKSNRLFPELDNLDITIRNQVFEIFRKYKPEIIIHAAANPSPVWCKLNPTGANTINVEGTKNIADAANSIGGRIIYISSASAINPNTIYSETKFSGEQIVAQTRGYVILQPSLVVGVSPNTSNDRFQNRLLDNITKNTPAVYDRVRSFQPTWLGHLTETIECIIEAEITEETIPVSVPEQKTKYDLAKDILSNFAIVVMPKEEGQYPSVQFGLEKLEQLNLPQYSYEEIIEKIVREMKDYLAF